MQHPRLRRLALQRLNVDRDVAEFLPLLRHNFRNGDATLLTRVVEMVSDEHVLHAVGLSLLSLYEARPSADGRRPLLALYRRGACGNCRLKLVELLYASNALPEAIRRQLPYDSYDGIRAWASATL